MERFNEHKSWLVQFTNVIWVECPKCKQCAKVIKDTPNNFFSNRCLFCSHCGYRQNSRKRYYTVSVKRNCPQCGKEIYRSINNVSEPKSELKVACPHCKYSTTYQAKNSEQFTVLTDSLPSDDYFYLPLWLVKPFKEQYVWAYNQEHLDFLLRYVSADLREKRWHDNSVRRSLEQKLPKWMKLAKNREKIIKILMQLQRKAC